VGGQSVFTGAEYQASVAAAVMAHMIAETRLNWLDPIKDEPFVISGETGGTGDDLRVELASGMPVIEVQAKRRLEGKASLVDTISGLLERAKADGTGHREIALVLGAGSSVEITDRFATDVRHLRLGRKDVRPITTHILETVDGAEALLRSLRVLPLDFGSLSAGGTQAALANLRLVLAKPDDAASAWDTLVAHGVRICKGGRATRRDVRELLVGRGIALKPVGSDARCELQLDGIRDLIRRDRLKTARVLLEDLEKDLRGKPIGALVRARLYNYLGVTRLNTHSQAASAEDFARALELIPRPKPPYDSSDPALSSTQGVNWADTTINYSGALYGLGRTIDAAVSLDEVFGAQLGRVSAYGLDARISFTLDRPARPVPIEIGLTPEYREHLAVLASMRENWEEAANLSNSAVAEGHAPGRLLALRARVLVNFAIELDDQSARRARFLEAERAASFAVERLEETELDTQLVEALAARAAARSALGDVPGADADYSRIEIIDPRNSNLIRKKVFELKNAGKDTEALKVLSDDLVKANSNLQLLRAMIAGSAGEMELAHNDLDAVLGGVPPLHDEATDNFRMEIAEVATRVDATDIAERALTGVSEAGRVVFHHVLRSRIAFARSQIGDGTRLYRTAASAAQSVEEREDVLVELATALARSGLFIEAAEVYEEVGGNEPTHRAFHQFVAALMRSENYEKADSALMRLEAETLKGTGSLTDVPKWALSMAIHIAGRQEQFSKVARYLEPLTRLEDSPENWLRLADAYLRIGEETRALEILHEVVMRPTLPPELRMTAANLLHKTSSRDEAIAQSFQALRDKPDDVQIIMNFIGLVMSPDMQNDRIDEALAGTVPDDPSQSESEGEAAREEKGLPVVVSDTWVRLTTQGADPIEYLIYEKPPVDLGNGEYLVTDSAVADIVGKAKGEIVIRNPGQWNERHYRVSLILPALVHVLRHHLMTFEGRFPDTPFIQGYHVGDKPTIETLGPILAGLRSNNQSREKIWKSYAEQRFPLGLIARGVRQSLSHVIAAITQSTDKYQYTQGADTPGLVTSVGIATNADTIVLTRQAVEAIQRLGLFDEVFKSFRVLLPESLIVELDTEMQEATRIVQRGQMSMVEAGLGFGLVEVKPGEARPWLERLKQWRTTLTDSATVSPRPLSALTEKDNDWREKLLGSSSFDAIAIARASGAALYADDYGLGIVAQQEFSVESFSTVALVTAWANADKTDAETFDDRTIRLIELRHYFVPLRASTIAAALRRDARTAQLVLDRIADPALDIVPLTVITAAALKALALGAMVSVSMREATVLITRALLKGRSPKDVVAPFAGACRELFSLMPQQLDEVLQVTKEVVRAVGVVPRIGGARTES
jgi:tetratricopeptide (TPR) repeat protein